MAETEKIVVENLYKVFGEAPERAFALLEDGLDKDAIYAQTGITVGVQDANFGVNDGEIFVVMGLSGSGKSTLVRMLNRLIDPTRGQVRIDGEDVTAMGRDKLTRLRREQMGMVFQHFALFPHKSVAENAEFGLKIRGVRRTERREKALEALAQVGLEAWANCLPSELSGGMQQRVGLARALAADASILLMDEPFSALDPLIRRDMQQELLQLESEVKKTIVFITHDLHEALILGDRIAIMKDGRIVQVGTGEEIVAEPADDYVAAFTQDVDRSRVFTAGTVMHDPMGMKLEDATTPVVYEALRGSKRRGVYLVDGDGRPVGLVTQRDIDRHGTDAPLERILRRKFGYCSDAEPLIDVYGVCANGFPIAVVDNDGRLQGVVEPFEVFAHVAGDTNGGDTTGYGTVADLPRGSRA